MSPRIEFERPVCGDLGEACSREWLETNGVGGFACSTIAGMNTRRYHALLTAAIHPPVGRFVLLSKVEETLVIGGQRFELSVNQYQGAVHPRGDEYLGSFRLDPFPIARYRCSDLQLEKTVFLVHGENTVVIQYELLGDLRGRTCALEVRPLIAFRDYHSTTHANDALRRDVSINAGLASITPYPHLPSLHFAHNAESVDTSGFWFYNFEYEREKERGLDALEDLYSPFSLRFDLAQNSSSAVIASTAQHAAIEADRLRELEIQRRARIVHAAPAEDAFARLLTAAADQFLVARGDQTSVIAGYPWFGDWGRDTMISLPGLTLVTSRFEQARNILRAFARNIDHGMLPNCFPDSGEKPEYNTVDATLWMFHAVHEFLRYTGDFDFVRAELYQPLADIIAWHERGTRYGIYLDSDGSAPRRRAGRAADMDGRQGWRLGGDASRRQTGGDSSSLVQRAVRDGAAIFRIQRSQRNPAAMRRLPNGLARDSSKYSGTKAPVACTTLSPAMVPTARCAPTRFSRSACPIRCSRTIRLCAWWMWWSGSCSRRLVCERFRRAIHATAGAMKAINSAAMALIIRARSGPGCWDRFCQLM